MAATPLLSNDALQTGSAAVTLGVLSECYVPGVIQEGCGDQRVSMVPDVAKALIKDGYKICVEIGAGKWAGFSDSAFEGAGCELCSRAQVISKSQMVFSINPPTKDFPALSGKILVSWVGRLLAAGKEVVNAAAAARVTLVDVTAVPRITIAQKLDVLSSQAKVAGHRAVVEATHQFGRFLAPEMTAAGKYPPSNTFILGCGVAGLAAIGTSKALGSVVSAWDVRDVSDQVASMGAKWVKVDFKEDGAGQGGYAKESSDEFKKAQQETFKKVLKETDIAITTAAIPGRPSPKLILKDAVEMMKPGSVIIDLAAVGGGNCELTKRDEIYTTPNGVTIIGYTDLAARMAQQSSAMYAQNMANLLGHISPKEKASGLLSSFYTHLDKGDDGDIVTRSIVCCRDGKLVVAPPPPPVGVTSKPKAKVAAKQVKEVDPKKDALSGAIVLSILVVLILGMGLGVVTSLLTTFLLAGAAGYQAVWGVAHALHTPLMSVTNAISGCTAVGGLLLYQRSSSPTGAGLGMIAILVSSINIIGGFVVSQRMLDLFKKAGDADFSYFYYLPALVFAIALFVDSKELVDPVLTISGLLCVMAIGGLATMQTANAGCKFGIVGVFGAVIATFTKIHAAGASDFVMGASLALMVIGGVFGVAVGRSVLPMQLPQTVAAFHSLVGLAAMATSIGSFMDKYETGASMENVSAILGDFIGGVTLTGSIVAFGKLNGNLSSKPLNLPGKNYLNLASLFVYILFVFVFLTSTDGSLCALILWLTGALACLMGVHLVGSVGGGDMPVCITVLNSYSGWALVSEGFLLNSPVLTIVGSLIGFSGAILTKIMCDAMNRDIFNVIFGGMNTAPVVKTDNGPPKEHRETTEAQVVELIAQAKKVLVVPGYGMAQARAQNPVGELAKLCHDNDVRMEFGIHPVAGRMPGQMNVLLAEAGVPYDWVKEMDEVNPEMESFDLSLIIGANDVVNSAAQEVEGCSIWGMPVIEVWKSKKVIFCKRSMGGGYADLENPVFFKENTDMLLGDGKKTAEGLVAKLRERFQ
jgi:NAD(P) transhydrogenase